MRIIAGDKRGARLQTLEGEDTRPTLERVKEGMFSSIQFLLPGAQVLDLYAGSGQLGLEALSRGAARCTFVDENRQATLVISDNAHAAGLFDKSRVLTMGAEQYLAQCRESFDIVLMDPPYGKGTLPRLLEQLEPRLAPGAVVLCESETAIELPQQVGALELKKQYRYGSALVSRYVLEQSDS